MKKLILALIGLVMVSSAAVAQQIVPNDPNVRVGKMPNGITYYIAHNDRDPQRANFHIYFKVGAIQEQDNQNGLAHFLEHMAFNGSKNFPESELISYLEKIGVRFGENLNAETGHESTTYMVTNVPVIREGIIDSALLILHDWAGFISLNNDDIDKERGVIREEWRQGNDASRRMMEAQFPVIFNNSIYAKRNVIGNEEVLRNFKYQELKDFYHSWYRPDMQAFVIVGDFDVDMMEKKLLATMADIPASTETVQKEKVVIENNEIPLVSVVSDPEATGTKVQLYFRHDPLPQEINNTVDAQYMDAMGSLIGEMFNQRMMEISQQPDAPFLGAGGEYTSLVQAIDVFYVGSNARDGEAMRALNAVYTELLRIQRHGFTGGELERAKANMIQRINSNYENRNDRRNRYLAELYMANFATNAPFPTPEVERDMLTALVGMVTIEQINGLASSYVRDQNSSILISSPAKEGIVLPTEGEVLAAVAAIKNSEIEAYAEEVSNEPLVSKKLKGSKIAKTQDGQFGSKIYTLKNGVKVVVKSNDYEGDKVRMTAFQDGGMSNVEDVADVYSMNLYGEFSGVAGVSKFSNIELGKMLAGKRASVSTSIDDISQGFKGSSSLKDIETLLQLTYLNYTEPRFNQTDWDVFINQYKAMIPNIKNNPDYIYQDSMVCTIYGHDPRMALISEKMLNMVSIERLEKTYRQLYSNARNMTFVFVGNIDEATFKPMIEKYLGSLPTTKEVPTVGKYKAKMVGGEVDNQFRVKLETPKVTATQVNHGKLDYSLENRLAANAISYILDIRYIKSIREEKGGTYGVRVHMGLEKLPEPRFALNISFQTDASKIDELMPIVQKEIDDLVRDGVSEENLNKYKEFNVKKFKENMTSNESWMYYLTSFYKIGDNYYDGYVERINGLTSDSLRSLAQKMFSQDNCIKIIMRPEEAK